MQKLKKTIIQLLKNKGTSILITDHNAHKIFLLFVQSYSVREGKILISGTVQQLLQNREARLSYFGEDFSL